MPTKKKAEDFLLQYSPEIYNRVMQLRKLLLRSLPGITEQLDIPAKMVMYTYGQSYLELVCVIIPSKKGLKLGFNRGAEFTDPDRLLEGTAKTSRYIVLKSDDAIEAPALKKMLATALAAYKKRCFKP